MSIRINYRNDEVRELYERAGGVKTWNSVGFDLVTEHDYHLPESVVSVNFVMDFGVSIKVCANSHFLLLTPRSSTFRKFGLMQTNSCGIIDPDYCGADDWLRVPVIRQPSIDLDKLGLDLTKPPDSPGYSKTPTAHALVKQLSKVQGTCLPLTIPKGTSLFQVSVLPFGPPLRQSTGLPAEYSPDEESRGGFGSTDHKLVEKSSP